MQTLQNHSQTLSAQPLVSFIITCYNLPAKLIGECIDSIRKLSLKESEREIIVVDDGSEESPINELMRYGDEVIYLRQRNKGLSEARNAGIQMARGEYLQFIDGDDRLLPAAYDFCLDIVREKSPEMLLFDFTHSERDMKKEPFDISKPLSGSEYMRHNNIRATACGYMFKHSILGDLRFTPGIFNEDEEFTPLLLLRTENVRTTNAKAYLYQQRPHSIMTDKNIRKRLKRLNDTKDIICRLNLQADRMAPNDKSALQRRVAQLTMDYLYNVIRETRSRRYLDRQIKDLHQKGLFPLPNRRYTTKYTWFRRMTNSPKGLSLLMRVIPFINKER